MWWLFILGEPSVDCDFNRVHICGYSGSNSRWYPYVDHTKMLVPSNESGGGQSPEIIKSHNA